MTAIEYMSLDVEQQLEIWFEGALVGRIELADDYTIVCKQIDGFYVEYLKKGAIWEDLRCFTDPGLLSPYLQGIDISDLIQA